MRINAKQSALDIVISAKIKQSKRLSAKKGVITPEIEKAMRFCTKCHFFTGQLNFGSFWKCSRCGKKIEVSQ